MIARQQKHSSLLTQDQLEQSLDGSTPSNIFQTPLQDFDALVALRPEALPFPDRAAPGSEAALHLLCPAEEDEDSEELLRHKKARARLHSFPQDLLLKKSPARLRRELLIGFDPVQLLLQHMQQHCAGSATLLVDILGGHAVGVKWNAKAMQSAQVNLGHASVQEPLQLTASGLVSSCMLSAPIVLSDIKAMGAGLVSHGVSQGTN